MRTHCALIEAVLPLFLALRLGKDNRNGEVFQRDVNALRLCVMAFDVLREEYSRTIQPSSAPGEWPAEILKLIRPYQYTKPL